MYNHSVLPRLILWIWATTLSLAIATPAKAQDASFSWTAQQAKEIAVREKAVTKKKLATGEWFFFSSRSYDVHTEIDARFTAELSLFMDLFREQFRGLFTPPSVVDRRPEVFVFGTRERFKEYLKSSARGWYRYHFGSDGKFDEHALYTYTDSQEERKFSGFYYPILLHEGTHQMLRETLGKEPCPKWFDEGLATYFQLWNLRLSKAENIQARSGKLINRSDFTASVREKRMPSLDALLALADNEWDPDDLGPIAKGHYSAGESLFMFLFSDASGQKLISLLYKEILARRNPADALTPKLRKQVEAGWSALVDRFAK